MLFDELWRFLGEIKSGNFTVSNSEITTFYSVLFSLFVNSFYHRLNITKLLIQCQLAKSNWRVSGNTSHTFPRHENVNDVTYSANVT